MNNKLSENELSLLCDLYLKGQLSRKEEKMLYLILTHLPEPNKKMEDIKEMMEYEKKAFLPSKSSSRFKLYFSGAAASLLAICAIAFTLIVSFNKSESSYTVWEDGVKITGERAKEITDESQREDMEMIRCIMKQHREMMKQNFASANMDEIDY